MVTRIRHTVLTCRFCSVALRCASLRAKVTAAVVRVGPVQHLAFVEGEEALPEEYDGHHICVYLTEEGLFCGTSVACGE